MKHVINLKMPVVMLLTICYIPALGQPPDTMWTRTYGLADHDAGLSVKETIQDSGYVIAGYTQSFSSDRHVYLIKTNSQGDTSWTRNFGVYATGLSILQTNDTGYVISGSQYYEGLGNVYLWKRDINGDYIWTKNYNIGDWEHGRKIRKTDSNGYIITGISNTDGYVSTFLMKTDLVGDTMWTRLYDNQVCEGYSLEQTTDGGYVIAGAVSSGSFFDIMLVKTNQYGDTLWTQKYGTSSGWDIGYDVLQIDNDGFVIAGQWGITNVIYDALIMKTDSVGNHLWTKTYGGTGRDVVRCIRQTGDGGYVMVGYTQTVNNDYDLWLLRTNNVGDTLWTRTLGGHDDDEGFEIELTYDGGYIIVGRTQSFGTGNADVWLVRMEPDNSGTAETVNTCPTHYNVRTIFLSGPLRFSEDKDYRIFDVTGRNVVADKIQPGIYYIEIDGVIRVKIIKIQ